MTGLINKLFNFINGSKLSESTLSHYIRLKQLCKSHQPIHIKVKHHYELFQSLVLSVDEKHHELVIDDLFPKQAESQLKPKQTIEFISETSGQQIKFYTRVKQRIKNRNKVSYVLALPKELGHNHNRRSFRVYVDTERGLSIRLNNDDPDFLGVRISNLSINGIKLHFNKNIHDKLSQGIFFDNAMIHLPNGYNIDCQIEIKNFYLLRTGHTRSVAGGSMTIPNPQHKKKLQQYLATVQRHQRRRENRVIE